MNEKQVFEKSMQALENGIGREAAARAYLVFAEAAQWCRNAGHGDLYLSAVNHLFAAKMRVKTIHTIGKSERG